MLAAVCSGWAYDAAWAISRVALVIWAYEEVARPANWFRRGIGIAVLVAVTVGLAGKA